MGPKRIYLDHNATTPLHPELKEKVVDALSSWGNPSSLYSEGRLARKALQESRESISEALQCSPTELVFTSGGSESNNMAIKGVYWKNKLEKTGRNKFLFSSVEHSSVRKTMDFLRSLGAEVYEIPVNKKGFIDLEIFGQLLDNKTALVSVMYANNETGNIFPIEKMAKKTHEVGALFHSDCVQALGKESVNMNKWGIDFASFSSHKVYSSRGGGCLYIKKGIKIPSLIYGGGQEKHQRAGTENVLSIVCFGFICGKIREILSSMNEVEKIRDRFEVLLKKSLQGVDITGALAPRLKNTSHLIISDIDGESLLMNLDIEGFSVSTGAACSSGTPEPSSTLLSMGFHRLQAQSSLRVSFGRESTQKEAEEFFQVLVKTVERLRKYHKLGSAGIS